MRKFILLSDPVPGFETALLSWAAGRKVAAVLQSHRDVSPMPDVYANFETCVAADAIEEIKNDGPAFDALKNFHEEKKDWLLGFLTYDLKNEIEKLSSENHDGLRFPRIHFFQPRFIFLKEKANWKIGFLEEHDSESSVMHLVSEISRQKTATEEQQFHAKVTRRVSRQEYERNVNTIKKHIQRGDIYEMNYCVEFYAEHASIQPAALYERLCEISPMPFSTYYKNRDQHVLCASPERFLAKRGRKIISQPIKGTAKRGSSREADEMLKVRLRNDAKEQSENVMIVDLVRNDLSKTAAKKSVKVEELFGIHSFRQLHQMISTVVSEMKEGVHWTDVVRNAFPMGSMTGAPKIRAMQLIEAFENTRRGLYSGAVGYITPEGDFDFNVVIRSILYNRELNYLSFMVGSAITINSDAAKEYEECQLKAKAMIQVLAGETLEKVN